MTADEFREGLKELGMTQAQFAKYCGVSHKTPIYWKRVGIPVMVSRLMGLMLEVERRSEGMKPEWRKG